MTFTELKISLSSLIFQIPQHEEVPFKIIIGSTMHLLLYHNYIIIVSIALYVYVRVCMSVYAQ